VEVKPPTLKLSDSEVEVRTLVVGGKEPLQLAYRLEKSSGQWKIYNVNVLGSWLVENYRTVFNQQISAGGIDGLINYLAERNKGTSRS
jgi:phospholipid transport system substrate-binding protein